MKWYRMAAQQGNPDAQKQLGVMYEEGDGVPKDAVEAEKWFRKAVIGTREKAEHGDPEAQANLGTMYYKGMGLPKDNDEAEKWYRKAAAQGNKYAQFQLDTIAWVQNYGKTIKAAKQGDPEAQEKLGEFYTFVDAGPEQLAEAANWFRKAAEQGSPKGQKTLGFLYYKGQGVPQDYSEAYFWNMLAVAAGEKESAEESSAIAAHLTPEQIAAEDKRIRAWKPTPAQPPAPAETTGAPDTK
jgi:TPR repeat protein